MSSNITILFKEMDSVALASLQSKTTQSPNILINHFPAADYDMNMKCNIDFTTWRRIGFHNHRSKTKKRAKKSVTIPSHAFSFSAAHFKSRAPKSLLSFSVLRCAKQIHRDSVFLFRFNTMCEFQIICFQSYRNICSCSTKCRKQNPQEKGLVCQGVCGCTHVCVWMLVWATVRVSLYVCGFNVPTPYWQ